MNNFPLIIIGSGPAGYTAAIYASRAELKPLVVAGVEAGGQLMTTTDVENYPGFPDGIQGPELMELFKKQSERFGTTVISGAVTRVDFSARPFHVWVGETEYTSDAIIIATGASAKWIGIESETRLRGKGVSSCATCDGYFFKGKEIVVVGGGDSAMEESTFLTKFATKVTIVHRRDAFKASKIMQQRALNDPKISVVWNSEVIEVLGDKSVSGVRLRTIETKEESELACQGLFVAIGHEPNTKIFQGQVALDVKGYVEVTERTRTNVEGVFVAGDVHDIHYRQAVTAAGFGCMAAMDAEKWLASA
ncbi:MAG: thioredoxin-disulfide reductase [bacterium]|nr:thioredoxin-disulfide reductase [bacterium]